MAKWNSGLAIFKARHCSAVIVTYKEVEELERTQFVRDFCRVNAQNWSVATDELRSGFFQVLKTNLERKSWALPMQIEQSKKFSFQNDIPDSNFTYKNIKRFKKRKDAKWRNVLVQPKYIFLWFGSFSLTTCHPKIFMLFITYMKLEAPHSVTCPWVLLPCLTKEC